MAKKKAKRKTKGKARKVKKVSKAAKKIKKARPITRKIAKVKTAKVRKVELVAQVKEPPIRETFITEVEVPQRRAERPIGPIERGKIKFKIENIVASANLEVELDLYAIAREVDNVEYEPEQFPGAILKLKEPKTSLLLFKNGKLICTGAKSEGEVDEAIHRAYAAIKHCIRKTTA